MARYNFITSKPERPEGVFPINLFMRTDVETGYPALMGTPGLTEFASIGPGGINAIEQLGGYAFFHMNNYVYRIDGSGTVTGLGHVSGNRIFMASNGFEILITNGSSTGYLANDVSGALTSVSLPAVASSLTFQDGYFVISERSSVNFYRSSYYDGATWDATDKYTASANPDNLVVVISDHNLIWAFGERSTQIFTNTGNADSTFEWLRGGMLQMGTISAKSLVLLDGAVFGLNDRSEVFRTTGYQHTVISPQVLSKRFSQFVAEYGSSGIFAYGYYHDGAAWFVLTFPAVNNGLGETWVYDASTQCWFQWSSGVDKGRHISNCYVHFNQMHIVGDYSTGNLYLLRDDVYTDAGNTIRREKQAVPIVADGHSVFFSRFEIYMKKGVGLVDATNPPYIVLQFSDDNGITWGNEHFASFGRIGEYDVRVVWRRLGSARYRAYRVVISEAVPVNIYFAWLDAEVGTS